MSCNSVFRTESLCPQWIQTSSPVISASAVNSPDSSTSRWDIFCRVVDNFGDIGVCWRIARDLASRPGIAVRLWVDRPEVFWRLQPEVLPQPLPVRCDGVDVLHWGAPFPSVDAHEVADVVIEAFACDLPGAYLAAMAARPWPPLWINLEYLSAEDWVGGCHGLSSRHPVLPLVKHFWFPGFDARTGGLPREPGLRQARDTFDDEGAAQAFLRALGWHGPSEALRVSLFAYENAGLGELLACWANGNRAVSLLVPEGRVMPDVAAFFGEAALLPGEWRARGALSVQVLPFVSQERYDGLLWSCDLNFVRGEDSFVRAQWAAHPFVWQIYRQDEDAHLPKLEAFLASYCAALSLDAATALRAFWRAWNSERGRGVAAAWPAFAAALPEMAGHARVWAAQQMAREDLVSGLVSFYKTRL